MKKIKVLIYVITFFALNLTFHVVNVDAQNPGKFVKHNKHGIKDRYIVSLINDPDYDGTNSAFSILKDKSLIKPGQVKKIFTRAIQGFSIKMTEVEAEILSLDPRVEMVEQNAKTFLKGSQTNAPFGLDRVDQRNLPLDTIYNYNYDGSGVHVYVLDDGINGALAEFGGRVTGGYNVFTNQSPDTAECGEHGTPVAALIGSQTYGVAKDVMLHSVRVLDCAGNGTAEEYVEGIEWVIANRSGPSVINASLGYDEIVYIIDNATQNAAADGITVVAASGNEAANPITADACNQSPGRVATLTVASSDSNDAVDVISSLGPCVDLFAPGEYTYTIRNTGAPVQAAGTSLAAPFVAGAAALLLQQKPDAAPYEVRDALVTNATPNVIIGDRKGAPNLLLYTFAPFPPVIPPAPQTVWNAVADFYTAVYNPAKAWSYGFRDGDCGTYTGLPYFRSILFDGSPQAYLGFWSRTPSFNVPFVGKNLWTSQRTFDSTAIVPTDLLVLYPGNQELRAVVRWTVPSTGTYNIAARFRGIDTTPTTSSYRILYNRAEFATGVISSYGTDIPFNDTFSLTAGNTIDFEVGNGVTLNNFKDSTGLDVTFTKLTTTAPKPRARFMCF